MKSTFSGWAKQVGNDKFEVGCFLKVKFKLGIKKVPRVIWQIIKTKAHDDSSYPVNP